MRELTDAELGQIAGGQIQPGGGVITALSAQNQGLNSPVFHAVPGLTTAFNNPGPDFTGHGQLTAAAARGS